MFQYDSYVGSYMQFSLLVFLMRLIFKRECGHERC